MHEVLSLDKLLGGAESPMKTHGYAPAVMWQGKIVLGGGKSSGKTFWKVSVDSVTSDIEEYDPQTKEWSFWKNPMPVKLWAHHMLNLEICENWEDQ